MLYIGNGRIRFYVTEQFVRNLILFEDFDYFIGYLKTDKVFICHEESLFETTTGNNRNNNRNSASQNNVLQNRATQNQQSGSSGNSNTRTGGTGQNRGGGF